DDRPASVSVASFVDDVKIFEQEEILLHRGIDTRNRLRLLTRLVEAPLGIHGRDLLIAFEYVDDGPLVAVVGVVVLGIGLADQRVRAEGHLVAESHFFLDIAVESAAKYSNDDQGNAEVHDVAAVAP